MGAKRESGKRVTAQKNWNKKGGHRGKGGGSNKKRREDVFDDQQLAEAVFGVRSLTSSVIR